MARKDRLARSEAVRERREQRERRKQTAPPPVATKPVGKTAHNTPILMRGAHVDVPVQPKKKARVRKRYDISLGSPGAEVQLPPVPFLQPSWRWLSGLIVLSLLGVLAAMWSTPVFQVQAIEITGLQRLDVREVHQVLGLQNRPVFLLDPAAMENDLLRAFPEFALADVRVGLPNRVSITVDERQPVLGWRNAHGMVLVDPTGFSFPARGLVSDTGQDSSAVGGMLPIVDAPDLVMAVPEDADPMETLNPYIGRKLLTAEQVAAILTIAEKAPAGASLVYDPAHGMGWNDPAGWIVYFGADGSEIGARLQVYASIVLDLQSRDIYPRFISIEFLHAPYYRMERD